MSSLDGFEAIAISPNKLDPGWKHCQTFSKIEDPEVVVKQCLYCGKLLQGGGISRLKAHLAGRKGNGPVCDQVPPDVRVSMQKHLDERVGTSKPRKSPLGKSMSRGFSGISDVFGENEDGGLVGGSDLLTQGEDVGMGVDVPIEVDDSLAIVGSRKVNVVRRKVGVANPGGNRGEGGVDRREGWRSGTSFTGTSAGLGLGSGSANGNRLSYAAAPIRSVAQSPFHGNTKGGSVGYSDSVMFENVALVAEAGPGNTIDRKRVRDEYGSMATNGRAASINGEGEKVNSQQIQMAIERFLYEIQAPLEAMKNSVYFQPMIDAIAYGGRESRAPSYHDLRGWILNDAVEECKNEINEHTKSWERNGCSLLVNQMNSQKGRILLNFSVYCSEGTTYLKSVDASTFINCPDSLYEILKQVVEEVGVSRVLQVITRSEEPYVVAGKRLMDTFSTLYWSPCAAACVDLILED